MGKQFDVPEQFDPNNLEVLLILVDNLRAAGVRTFEHPSGLKLTLDTKREVPVSGPRDDEF